YVTDNDGNVTSRTCSGQTVTFTWTAESRLASYTVGGQDDCVTVRRGGVAGAQGRERGAAEPRRVGRRQPARGADEDRHRARRGVFLLRAGPTPRAVRRGHGVQRPCRRPGQRDRADRRRADRQADLRLYGVGTVRGGERPAPVHQRGSCTLQGGAVARAGGGPLLHAGALVRAPKRAVPVGGSRRSGRRAERLRLHKRRPGEFFGPARPRRGTVGAAVPM